mmetsp:Transcript_2793/g.8355  ORF Transcript_2793/g.8355 Transcript_2793/m.8355 type:complete len:211 (-) Transcript_2793:427-1059(-)
MTGGVVSATVTLRSAGVAATPLASATLYRSTCSPSCIMLGRWLVTNRVRTNGAAVSRATHPGSRHLVAASTVMALGPLRVMTGEVWSRQIRLDGVAPPAPEHGCVSVKPAGHVLRQSWQKVEPTVYHCSGQQFADAGRLSVSESGPGHVRPLQAGGGLVQVRVRVRLAGRLHVDVDQSDQGPHPDSPPSRGQQLGADCTVVPEQPYPPHR